MIVDPPKILVPPFVFESGDATVPATPAAPTTYGITYPGVTLIHLCMNPPALAVGATNT